MGLPNNLLIPLMVSGFIIIVLMAPSTHGLRCYQCFSNSLEPCAYEDLRECPRKSFYNRCIVQARKTRTGETFVRRECDIGCSGGYDDHQSSSNGGELSMSNHCDTSQPEYECKVCCRGDGCNYSGAMGLQVPTLMALALVSLISLILA